MVTLMQILVFCIMTITIYYRGAGGSGEWTSCWGCCVGWRRGSEGGGRSAVGGSSSPRISVASTWSSPRCLWPPRHLGPKRVRLVLSSFIHICDNTMIIRNWNFIELPSSLQQRRCRVRTADVLASSYWRTFCSLQRCLILYIFGLMCRRIDVGHKLDNGVSINIIKTLMSVDF